MSDFAQRLLAEAGANVNGDGNANDVGRFPRELWDARPLFKHCEKVAIANVAASPEALLAIVLGHITTHIPPAFNLPGPPRKAPPNLLICVTGHPGWAKGSVFDLAQTVIPPPITTMHRSLSTAQGFAKAFYRERRTDDPDDGKGMVRHHSPVIFRTNEIGTFAGLIGNRNAAGDLLLGELKQAFSGERLGYDYATNDKAYPVEPYTYRMLGLFGVAPQRAESLFTDAGGGTPDRLLFVTARASLLATVNTQTVDNAYSWMPPPVKQGAQVFGVDESVRRRMQQSLLMRAQSIDPSTEFEAHIDLQRLKIACAMAYADCRWHVTMDDYDLAGMIIDAHREVRDWVIACVGAERKRHADATTHMLAGRQVTIADALDEREQAKQSRRTIDAARKLAHKVRHASMTHREVKQTMRNYRELVDDAVDHAKAEQWIIENNMSSHTGSDSRTYVAGPVVPPP